MATKTATSKKTPTTVKWTTEPVTITPERKGRKPVDPNETKDEKLARLGTHRVTQAVNRIRLVGNLASYKPSDEQIDKIMIALGEICAQVEARLRGVKKSTATFTF